MKKFVSALALLTLAGCISVTSQPVRDTDVIDNICIQRNAKVIVPGFVDALRSALSRHGIATEVYDDMPEGCRYHMTYVAYQGWDFVMFMSNAHLDLYNGNRIIGSVDRHMPFGSGFDFSKWNATQTKVDQMVDQLLAALPQRNDTPAAQP